MPTVTPKKSTKSSSSKSSKSSSKKSSSSASADKSKKSALKDPDGKSSEAAKKEKSAVDEAIEAAADEQGMNHATGMPLLDPDSRKSPEFWMKLITAGGVLALLLLGMCLRTYLFARAKERE